jgi:hypothetical protein
MIPSATVMSGGYGEQIKDTVEIHCNTIRAARSIFGVEKPGQPGWCSGRGVSATELQLKTGNEKGSNH